MGAGRDALLERRKGPIVSPLPQVFCPEKKWCWGTDMCPRGSEGKQWMDSQTEQGDLALDILRGSLAGARAGSPHLEIT